MYNSSLISARFRRVTEFIKFIQCLCFSALLVICKLSKYIDESEQKQASLLQKNLKLEKGSLNYYYFEKQIMIIVHFYSAHNHYNKKVLKCQSIVPYACILSVKKGFCRNHLVIVE